ncbi:MAG TPA: phosphomannomutase/phosphoglucomutase [Syntrophorhabdales bacterium]|nr:phosphomannomutase/phosphoglucomutase [Syntrophorhabdales bacterium]
MNRSIFREYDIRGNVQRDLTDDVVSDIGKALATYMKERGKRVATIGRDCRLSSEHYRDLLVESMVKGGLDVTDLGVVPTPLFYFSLFKLNAEGGVMVTGSHNPPEFNGFKVAFDRTTLYGPEIQSLGDIIEQKRFVQGNGSCSQYPTIVADYYSYLRGNLHLDRKLKVAVDAGNGTAGVVACPIMEEMGQEVIPLFCDMDGHFPNHFPDPTVETNMEALKKTVLDTGADLGIGYDGDGDRIGVIDEKGNIIWGDYLMIIFAREILKAHKGASFVSEVKCSKNLYEDIEKNGGKAVMWKAGHSLIKKKMKEVNAVLGGEMSGHMFFADNFFGYDDAVYASLRLLELMGKRNAPLSQFLSDLPKTFSTPEIRVDCAEDVKFGLVQELTDFYRQKFPVIDIDGVRVVLPDGWGLVRASNTQPILVLRFEADTQQGLERIQRMVMNDLQRIMKERE